MHAEKAKSKDLRVQLQYLADDPLYKSVKPLQWIPASLDRKSKSNIRLVPGEPETIYDVRGIKHGFDLDQNGFRYVKAPTTFKDWESDAKIGSAFIPEMEELLRRELEDCDKIFVFDFRVMHRNGSESLSVCGPHDNLLYNQVHVDWTEKSVASLVRKNFELEADHLLAGRVRLINICRPINHVVYDCPLAIADGGKLDVQTDVIEIDCHNPNTGEFCDTIGGAHYRQGYDWYYMSEQAEEDVLLFKNYDSDRSVSATTCLHTGFDIPPSDLPPESSTRESIEVQALIFTYLHGKAPPNSPELRRRKIADQKTQFEKTTLLRTQLSMLQDEVHHNKSLLQAVLDLRQWESKRTADRLNHLLSDRDHSRAEAIALSSQLNFLEERITEMYIERGKSSQRDDVVMEQIHRLILTSPRLRKRFAGDADAHESLNQAKKLYGPDAELLLLREQLEVQKAENQKLKTSINSQAEDKKDEDFHSAVNEAVNHERIQNELVFQSLRNETQELRRRLYEKTPLKW